jgi:WD40 repeat protein
MRLLKVRGNFAEMAYLGPRTLVTREGHTFPHPVRVWDLTTDAVPDPLSEAHAEVARLVFRHGGAEFLRRDGLWAEGGLPDLAKTGPILRLSAEVALNRPLPGGVGGVGRVFAFAPDGEHLLLTRCGAIAGREYIHFQLRDPAGGTHALHQGAAMIKQIGAFSPSGRLAAMSCGNKVVAVWDVRERHEVTAFEANGGVTGLAFVSEDRLLVAAGRSAGVWEAATGRLVKKFRAFHRGVGALAVSADLHRYAAGDGDGTVRVWEATTGREVGEYNWGTGAVEAVAFSPDGSTAAAVGSPAGAVWDLD